MVEVQVFGPLWDHLEPSMVLELEGCAVTVADLLAHLEVNVSEVGIVTVDGRQSRFDKRLPASCRVCVFPVMSGG
jgi:molybdopterin converting factor small subunit